MTTDITELAQSLKAAAEKATPGEWVYFPKNASIEYDVGSDESQGSILYVDSGDFTQAQTDRNGEFIALANPANIIALVEVLEKAQLSIAELESRLNSADKLQDSAFRSGLQHGFSLGQTDDQKGYEQSMAAYSLAAGIKVEAE